MSLPTQLINIRLTKELLLLVDQGAEALYVNRSEFIRQAIVEKLRGTTPDVWPSKQGFNILATDEQLDDLWDTIRTEIRRRRTRRLHG